MLFRLAKERDLEGIDVSNIVQGGRRCRRGAAVAAPINYAAIGKATSSDDEEGSAGDESSSEEAKDSDATGSADEGGLCCSHANDIALCAHVCSTGVTRLSFSDVVCGKPRTSGIMLCCLMFTS